jgi:predicted PurR-regulated permease PerM
MLGIDARAARASWTVLLVAGAVAMVYAVRRTLLIFVVALLLAYMLAPLVELAGRVRRGRVPRAFSRAGVYVILLGVLGLAAAAFGGRIYQEAALLAENIPTWLRSSESLSRVEFPSWMQPWKQRIIEAVVAEIQANVQQVVPLVGRIGQGLVGVAGNLAFAVLVPVLSFLFLKDAALIRSRLLEQLAGSSKRAVVEEVLADVHLLLGQFIRALVILAAATFVVYGLFLVAVGLPYAVLLAGLAGGLEFIPMIGPFSAGVAIVLVAILSGHGHMAVWIIVFLLGYRLFQDYVLQPFLMSKGVALHPLWVIFGVLAGEQIGGVAGMFLSIPVLATLRVIYVRMLKSHHRPV